jgi:hypothetical protein
MLSVSDFIVEYSACLKKESGVDLSSQLLEFSKVIARDCVGTISNENGDLEKAILKIIENYKL